MYLTLLYNIIFWLYTFWLNYKRLIKQIEYFANVYQNQELCIYFVWARKSRLYISTHYFISLFIIRLV